MEITLEKIELVKDRTGVSYREAKDALEKTEGNVVDAIIMIEDHIDDDPVVGDSWISTAIESIKDAVRKGNASKLVIKKDGEVLLNLPVNIGLIGTVLFPWAAVAATIAAFGTKCSIELLDDKGETIDVSTKAQDYFETAKNKGGVIFDEVKDKSSEFYEYAKDKGEDAFNVAKEKGTDVYNSAKEFSKDAIDTAKDIAKNAVNKEGDSQTTDFGDFDLSDLDLSELERDDE
jgi:gas vesicle protein